MLRDKKDVDRLKVQFSLKKMDLNAKMESLFLCFSYVTETNTITLFILHSNYSVMVSTCMRLQKRNI